jgi:hypothetical protein
MTYESRWAYHVVREMAEGTPIYYVLRFAFDEDGVIIETLKMTTGTSEKAKAIAVAVTMASYDAQQQAGQEELSEEEQTAAVEEQAAEEVGAEVIELNPGGTDD